MSKIKLSSSTQSQCDRLLARLREGPITSLEAREELDIFHPPRRICDLRESGHSIVTDWEYVDTGRGEHRIGRYALLTDQ